MSNMTLRRTWVVAMALGLAATASGQTWTYYELIELESERGGGTKAYAVNNTGQIVGWLEDSGTRHSAHWHNYVTTDLHGLVHFELQHRYPLFPESYSEAYDVSDADQVVGTARTSVDCDGQETLLTNAFILRPAVLSDLASPYPGDALTNLGTLGNPCLAAYDSAATAISDNNYIVGWTDLPGPIVHAFLVVPEDGELVKDEDLDLVNDLMHDLGVLDDEADPVSSATAVNNSGQITGYSYTMVPDPDHPGRELSRYHAFLVEWEGDRQMRDIDEGYEHNSWGRAINNSGVIVGEREVAIDNEVFTHAFLYRTATEEMVDLDAGRARNSAASGINDDGVVVGWYENEDRERRAFVYDPDRGEMVDLNDVLYLWRDDGTVRTTTLTLTEARDVNEGGVIVGWGDVQGSDAPRAFLLNPKLVTQAELDELSASGGETDSSGDTDADTHSDPDSPDYDSDAIFGPPDGLGPDSGTGDANDVTAGETAGTSPWGSFPGLCGGGTLAMLPLTVLGLAYLKWRR